MDTQIAEVQHNDIMDPSRVESAMKFAEIMAKGVATVPKHFQGKPADCLAVVLQAMRWGMDPYVVGQKTHVVGGNLGYEAQLVNAVVSSSRAIEGRFKYEFSGEWKSDKDPTAWVRVGAILRGEDGITWGEPLYPAQVATKNSPLWKSAPKQQAAYLAVKYWARLYTPEVIMGIYTADEFDVVSTQERDITPAAAPVSALRRPEPEQPAAEVSAEPESAAPALKRPSPAQIEATIEAIGIAENGELEGIGKRLQEYDLNDDDRQRLGAAYKARQAELQESAA